MSQTTDLSQGMKRHQQVLINAIKCELKDTCDLEDGEIQQSNKKMRPTLPRHPTSQSCTVNTYDKDQTKNDYIKFNALCNQLELTINSKMNHMYLNDNLTFQKCLKFINDNSYNSAQRQSVNIKEMIAFMFIELEKQIKTYDNENILIKDNVYSKYEDYIKMIQQFLREVYNVFDNLHLGIVQNVQQSLTQLANQVIDSKHNNDFSFQQYKTLTQELININMQQKQLEMRKTEIQQLLNDKRI